MIRATQFIILFGVLSIISNESGADVFSYTSEDGSVCFTDMPGKKNAVLFLRDSPLSKKKNRAGTGPFGKSLTSISKTVKDRNGNTVPRFSMLPVNGLITSPPGFRSDPFTGMTKNHHGIDIAVAKGTSVRPVSAGIITYSGYKSGYGNIVIVDHENGTITLYAHNSQNMVSTGEKVGTNTIIALTGSTGRSTGPHLHFEAWRMGENITPQYLPESWGARRFASVHSTRSASLPVRKVVMDDGTIVLTNLPLNHP